MYEQFWIRTLRHFKVSCLVQSFLNVLRNTVSQLEQRDHSIQVPLYRLVPITSTNCSEPTIPFKYKHRNQQGLAPLARELVYFKCQCEPQREDIPDDLILLWDGSNAARKEGIRREVKQESHTGGCDARFYQKRRAHADIIKCLKYCIHSTIQGQGC